MPEPPGRSAFWASSALSNRQFLRLQCGYFVSNVGTFFEHVAQSWLVYELTDSKVWVGYHALAVHGPTILLSLFGGALADRLNRRKLLFGILTVWMCLATTLAILAGANKLTAALVIAIAFGEGVLASVSRPVMSSMTQDVVGREKLPSALAVASAAFNLARVIGPAVGGMMIAATGGVTASFTMNALSFVVVLLVLWRLRLRPQPPPPKGSLIHRLRLTVRYGLAHGGLRRLWWGTAIFSLLSGPINGLLVAYSDEALGMGERGYGFLLSGFAVGAIGGAAVSSYFPKFYPRHHLIPASALVYGIVGIAFALSREFWLSLVLLAFVGVCHSTYFVSSMTAVQLLSPEKMRGQIISVQNLVTFGTMPLGSLLCGYVAEDISTPYAVAIMMAFMALFGFHTLRNREPLIEVEFNAKPRKKRLRRSSGDLWEGITAQAHRNRRPSGEYRPSS